VVVGGRHGLDEHDPFGDPSAQPWRTADAVEFTTLEWAGASSSPSDIPHAEAEARYYAQTDEPTMAA
jgi:hypothetical protein